MESTHLIGMMEHFKLMALEMQDITPAKDGGVLKKILKRGIGQIVPDGAMVKVHYNGHLEYIDEPHDSSRLQNRQQQFVVGKGECIVGLDVAVSTMRKGELSRFLISPAYAFGELGCPPRIPPNSIMIIDVELTSFIDYSPVVIYNSLSKELKKMASVNLREQVATAKREIGNNYFYQNKFGEATKMYEQAVTVIQNACRFQDIAMCRDCLFKVYLDLTRCCLKQVNSPKAIAYCKKVLKLKPNPPLRLNSDSSETEWHL